MGSTLLLSAAAAAAAALSAGGAFVCQPHGYHPAIEPLLEAGAGGGLAAGSAARRRRALRAVAALLQGGGAAAERAAVEAAGSATAAAAASGAAVAACVARAVESGDAARQLAAAECLAALYAPRVGDEGGPASATEAPPLCLERCVPALCAVAGEASVSRLGAAAARAGAALALGWALERRAECDAQRGGGAGAAAESVEPVLSEQHEEQQRPRPLIVEIEPEEASSSASEGEAEAASPAAHLALWRLRAQLASLVSAMGRGARVGGALLLAEGCAAVAARIGAIADAGEGKDGGGSSNEAPDAAVVAVLAASWADYGTALLRAEGIEAAACSWLAIAGAARGRGTSDTSDSTARAREAALLVHSLGCAALGLGRVPPKQLEASPHRGALLEAAAAAAKRAHALPRRAQASRKRLTDAERAQELASVLLGGVASPADNETQGLAMAAPALLCMLDEVDGVSQAAAGLVARAACDAWMQGDSGPFGQLAERLKGDSTAVRRNTLEAIGAVAAAATRVSGSADTARLRRAEQLLSRCQYIALERLGDEALAARWEASAIFCAGFVSGNGCNEADAGPVLPLACALASVDARERSAAIAALRASAARDGLQAATLYALLVAAELLGAPDADLSAVEGKDGVTWRWPERLRPSALSTEKRARAGERAAAMAGELVSGVPAADAAGVALFALARLLEAPSAAPRVRNLRALGAWLGVGPQLQAYLLALRSELRRSLASLKMGRAATGSEAGAPAAGPSGSNAPSPALLQQLAPLLALRVLPLRALDGDADTDADAVYGEGGLAEALLFLQASSKAPPELRKVAAELCGHLRAAYILPRAAAAIAASARGASPPLACLPWLFTTCACLTARTGEKSLCMAAAPARRAAVELIEALSGGQQETRRAVLGAIDVLAVCVVAELAEATKAGDGAAQHSPLIVELDAEHQGDKVERGSSPRTESVLGALLDLISGVEARPACLFDTDLGGGEGASRARLSLAVRICAGNALISCCKMLRDDSQKGAVAARVLPRALAICSGGGGAAGADAAEAAALRAVALQVAFTAVYHVGAATAPHAAALARTAAVALASPSAGGGERAAAARLLAALLASDEAVTCAMGDALPGVLSAVRGAAAMDADPMLRALCERVEGALEVGEGAAQS